MLNIPWSKKSRVRKDLAAAQRILDEDHYGLEEVKDRIIEYLAVQTGSSVRRGRCSAWLVLPEWARPVWVRVSRGRPTVKFVRWPSAAFVTKPKYGVTDGLTSARCRQDHAKDVEDRRC